MRWIPVLLIVILVGCGDIPQKQHAVYLDRVAGDISMAEQWKCGLIPLEHQIYVVEDKQYVVVTTPPDTVSWWIEHPERMGVTLSIGENHLLAVSAEWISDNILEVTMLYGKCYIWDGYYSCPDIGDRGQVPQVFHCLSETDSIPDLKGR